MEKKVSILNNRSVIKISGRDNLLFLNNIISSDLEKINNEELFITTLLSPQGKILFDFFIIKNEDYYLIECSNNQLNDLINKLIENSTNNNIILDHQYYLFDDFHITKILNENNLLLILILYYQLI